MAEISNNTLAILVMIATLISVIGILNSPGAGIFGAASGQNTTSGVANISIQTVQQLNLLNNTMDFGYGFVNGSDNACILESNNSQRMNSTGGTFNIPCANASGGFGFFAPARAPNLVIENSGNFNISLTINGSYANARAFLCNASTSVQNCSFFTPEYNWSAANYKPGSCSSGGLPTGFVNPLTTTVQTVCSNMNASSNNNSIQLAIRLVIPRDSIQTLLTDNITFTATS